MPSQLYRTADGWIFVMCQKQKFWVLLAAELGRPEWAADPRFASLAARLERRDELTRMLDAEFSRDTTAGWLAKLSGKLPVAPVYDVAQALDNPFVAERGGIADLSLSRRKQSPTDRQPDPACPTPSCRAAPRPPSARTPTSCLRGLGYSEERIAALRAARADRLMKQHRYERIAQALEQRIASGSVAVGETLPDGSGAVQEIRASAAIPRARRCASCATRDSSRDGRAPAAR